MKMTVCAVKRLGSILYREFINQECNFRSIRCEYNSHEMNKYALLHLHCSIICLTQ